ncbi:hypothetical protein B0H13DRAFT_1855139 [Mycena leptocephala]|nr:hypothetical protein B0H13DRAFT_1855139 [Mycena leptocephala]
MKWNISGVLTPTIKGENHDNYFKFIVSWGKSFALLHDPWVDGTAFSKKVAPPLAPASDIFKAHPLSPLYQEYLTATIHKNIPEKFHRLIDASEYSDFSEISFIIQMPNAPRCLSL